MWDPTHVQVTVQRARGLVIKGKNGTNNCFVTIALGKEKFQTSIKHKATENVEWLEECELRIPTQGNVAEIVLKVLDQDKIKDHLLGQVSIPLKDLDPYDRPRNRWYPLTGKPGKEVKNRGELEVKIGFIVKEGSLTDLSKKDKHRSSLSSLAHNLGGSLMSIGTIEKRKGIKNFAKNLGSKINLNKKDKKSDSSSLSGSFGNLKSSNLSTPDLHSTPKKVQGEADPGVISEDEDEFAFDDLSHKSSGSSLNVQTLPRAHKYTPSPVNASLENLGGGEFLRRSTISHLTTPEKSAPSKPVRLSLVNFTPPPVPSNVMVDKDDEWAQKLHSKLKSNSQSTIEREKSSSLERNIKMDSPSSLKEKPSPKFFKKFGHSKPKKLLEERIIVGEENIAEEENSAYGSIPHSVSQQLNGKSREDLVLMIYNLQKDVESEKKKNKDLENYLDDLLLRVMETTPRILQNPYVRNNSMFFRNK